MRYFLIILLSIPGILSAGEKAPSIFIEAGKQGLKDENGNVLIEARFDRIGWSNGDSVIVDKVIGFQDQGRWGLISTEDKIISDARFQSLIPSGQTIIASRPDPSMRFIPSGLINTQGRELVPFKYLHIADAGTGLIVISATSRYGVIDKKNHTILPANFADIKYLGQGRLSVLNDSGNRALFNDTGTPLTTYTFDRIEHFRNGRALASVNRSLGLLSLEGKWIVEPHYSEIEIRGSSAIVTPFATWEVLTEKNKRLHSVQFDSVLPWQEAQWKVIANDHEWIVDTLFKAITPDTYNHIDRVNEQLLAFADDDKYGVMHMDGSFLINANFDTLFSLNKRIYAFASIGVNRGWSLYDHEGNRLTSFAYQEMRTEQSSGLIPVKRNMFWGLLDRSGNETVPCTYDSIGASIPGLFVVKFKGKSGIINETGEWVLTPKEGEIELINDRYFLQKNENTTYLKSYESGTVYFTENPIQVKEGYMVETTTDQSYWKINFSGRILNLGKRQEYEEIGAVTEEFIAVRIDGKYGFIDLEDRLRIANRYDGVHDFHEDLAAFSLLNRWGFINKQEQIVIQPIFESVQDFENGLCIVTRNGKKGVIDKEGTLVITAIYDDVTRLTNGRYLIVKNGRKGLLDVSGRIIINPKYEELIDLEGGQVIVRNYGKYGLISRNGVDLIPISYDYLRFDPFNHCYLGMKKTTPESIPLR